MLNLSLFRYLGLNFIGGRFLTPTRVKVSYIKSHLIPSSRGVSVASDGDAFTSRSQGLAS